AVLAILALLIAFVAPSLGTLTGRKARNTAEAIAATLELARQRTVMTGVPHRVHLDLDEPSWRLEWWVSDAEENGEEAPAPGPHPRSKACAGRRRSTSRRRATPCAASARCRAGSAATSRSTTRSASPACRPTTASPTAA